MLRIGQVEATATQDGKYTDGSVAGGIAATRLRAAAFNAMQEELAHIVESAGLALDINDMTQVLKAIQKLTLSRANPFADIKSDGAAAIATALSNLGLKEAAKRDVGTGVGQIPDMSAFTSGPGWVRFPDGTTIQQGSAGFATGVNNQYVTLPRAFSSANFRVATVWNDVGVSQGGTAAQAAADIGLGTGSKTTTRFGLWQGGSGGFNVDWIAIGVS
ncbi:hypothetical protein RZP48_02170 [Enterobacter asburiae]|uniref:Putative tail fiber protein gp53-like C-terminal domain-containing protein n=1 Tax=Enterobacter asburiae TaxID=61645 RepID=A0AAW7ZYW6_ENTAS|nr:MULTISPECIES: hypothetical protein [Enterobacter cloacae complex]MCL8161682.1 hypothetical protein [Enterobacter asburiae]MCM7939337.1 hypothetical protein [Enterobacter asburiae]MDO7925110.1 hypothetical protein [Enterobacter asburiae]MDV0911576.1 hypothetical protein [Enterobacter asburiae]MDV0931870.1 hypothetical protein [Enterobacter asburiae]